MNRFYMTCGSALFAMGTFAQAHPMHVTPGSAQHPSAAVHLGGTGAPKAGGGGCIFSENFEGGTMPNGWDIGAAIATVPPTTSVPAWVVGDADAADAAGNFDVPDQPSGNLFAMANDDAPPCDCAMTDIGLTTPSIDLTGLSGLGLSFRVFLDGRFGDSSGKVEVSTDGGNQFTTLRELDNVVEIWRTISINLSDYEGMSDIRFRFQFDDGGDWVSGMAIDDVCIAPLPDNDVTLVAGFFSDITASVDDYDAVNQEYTLMPLEQTIPMTFCAIMTNNGLADQTNIVLTATVDGTPYTSSPYPLLASGATDTLVFHSPYTPSTTGTHDVELSIVADADDANPADNTTQRGWINTGDGATIPDLQMGTDGNFLTGFVLLSTGPDVFGDINAVGEKSEIQNAGSTAYGVGVALYQLSHIGASFDAMLLEDTPDGLTTVAVSDVQFVTQDMLNGGGGNKITFIPFDAVLSDPNVVPAVLDPTKDYIAFVETVGSDTVSVGLSGIVQPGGIWDISNSGDPAITQYVGAGNTGAMVRLFLGPSTVGISELNSSNAVVTLGANMPNPFNGFTTIQYSLKESRGVTLRIYDMAGHLVMEKAQGTQGPGQHLIDLDGKQLAPGVYTYSLQAGEDRLTRRMVVTN